MHRGEKPIGNCQAANGNSQSSLLLGVDNSIQTGISVLSGGGPVTLRDTWNCELDSSESGANMAP